MEDIERVQVASAILDKAALAFKAGDLKGCRGLLTDDWAAVWVGPEGEPMGYIPYDLFRRFMRGWDMLDKAEGLEVRASPEVISDAGPGEVAQGAPVQLTLEG